MKINTMVKAFLAVTIVANCTLTAQSKVIEGKVETQEILPTINFANLTAQLDKSGLSFKENCAPFDPDKIQLVKQNSRWIISGHGDLLAKVDVLDGRLRSLTPSFMGAGRPCDRR
jgi:hypothetical protein